MASNLFANYYAYIYFLTLVVGAGVLIWNSVKTNNSKYDKTSIRQFEDAIKARDLTIMDLQAQIVALNKQSTSEKLVMQTQIDTIKGQVRSLEEANKVLSNTVTGKEILNDIQATLLGFKPYISAFDQFVAADQQILAKLDTISSQQFAQANHPDQLQRRSG
jgi:hypothetical protein